MHLHLLAAIWFMFVAFFWIRLWRTRTSSNTRGYLATLMLSALLWPIVAPIVLFLVWREKVTKEHL